VRENEKIFSWFLTPDAKKAKVHRSVSLPFGTSEQIFQAIGEQYFLKRKH
jgi:hypothetical protein